MTAWALCSRADLLEAALLPFWIAFLPAALAWRQPPLRRTVATAAGFTLAVGLYFATLTFTC